MTFAWFHLGQALDAGPDAIDAAIIALARDWDPQWFHVSAAGNAVASVGLIAQRPLVIVEPEVRQHIAISRW